MNEDETLLTQRTDMANVEELPKEEAENTNKANNWFVRNHVFALAVVLSLCSCLVFSWFRHGGNPVITATSSSGNVNNNFNLRPSIDVPLAEIAQPSSGCFTSTKDMFEAMLRADPAQEHVYKICPNTVIDVGSPDDSGDCCINGDYSLFLRTKSTVQCGDFGRVQDNCVLRGGNSQIFYVGTIFGDDMAESVKVKGLTFESAEFVSVALANRGDITFENCLWKVCWWKLCF